MRVGEYAVHLIEDGQLHSFLPGDEVPAWAVEKITNPDAWDSPKGSPEKEPDGASPDGPPPHKGPGASRQAWVDYAESHGVEVSDTAKREDIIAACKKAGVEV